MGNNTRKMNWGEKVIHYLTEFDNGFYSINYCNSEYDEVSYHAVNYKFSITLSVKLYRNGSKSFNVETKNQSYTILENMTSEEGYFLQSTIHDIPFSFSDIRLLTSFMCAFSLHSLAKKPKKRKPTFADFICK